MVTHHFFFSLSSSPSSLHILSNSPTSIFLYKNVTSLSFLLTIWFFSLKFYHLKLSLPNSLIFSMAPKSKTKKTSYVLSSNAFNLTRRNGAIRLNESPPLTYKPQDYLSEGARAELLNFSNFSHFWVLLWSSILICFWTCKSLGFAVGWV